MLKPHTILGVLSIVLSAMGIAQAHDSKKIKIVTTTTMITDMVEHIAGDHATVEGLMGPGVDPHLYKATAKNLQKLDQADLVFYNGLMLEGKMHEIFENMAERQKRVVIAIAQYIPSSELIYPDGHQGHVDPHIWFSPQLWAQCIPSVVEGLLKVDPGHKEDYERAAAALTAQYLALDTWIHKRVAEVAPQNRILVTSHDAFNYFGRDYGFQVIGVQGISTVAEAGLADMSHTEDMIK
ncbi:MAG: zinc ABC transporter substrate-binding protein, partial [Gammaproteobacteria bacterium]|nr:zinc ABC transporter substrate-binding protein [Gammaproteobacteria bacterium]